jgi:hypothetical protein
MTATSCRSHSSRNSPLAFEQVADERVDLLVVRAACVRGAQVGDVIGHEDRLQVLGDKSPRTPVGEHPPDRVPGAARQRGGAEQRLGHRVAREDLAAVAEHLRGRVHQPVEHEQQARGDAPGGGAAPPRPVSG